MQLSPKRIKIIAFVVVLCFWIGALFDVFVKEHLGNHSAYFDSDSLVLIRAVLIFLSAYGLVAALAFQIWRKKVLDRLSKSQSRFSPETRFLVINIPLLFAPTLFGQLLYEFGISSHEFFYFIGASIVTTLAWLILDLRKM